MELSYTLDDSTARLPLAFRSVENLWDRAAELRSEPGLSLVELTTQHLLSVGASLIDELAYYFDYDAPSETDPYALAACYANRAALEDLLRDLHDAQPRLIALHEVAEMFPATFTQTLQFTLVLTAVGYPAFGYVRTYRDSDDGVYHGLVVNLAQAWSHLMQQMGRYSLELLIDTIRGFFNHEAFRLAYAAYNQAVGRESHTFYGYLNQTLLSRGIAWYLSYRHDFAFYDEVLGLDEDQQVEQVRQYNRLLSLSTKKRALDETAFDAWLQHQDAAQPAEQCLSVLGYGAARAIAAAHGEAGLRASIAQGPEHFIALYNALHSPELHIQDQA